LNTEGQPLHSIEPPLSEESIASLVKRVRVDRGLTQEGLARELGVSFATINGWENGRHHPIPALALKLAGLAGHRERGPENGAADIAPSTRTASSVTTEELVARGGWPFTGRERRDFYHHPREFPPDVARWRTGLVDVVKSDHERFPDISERAARAAASAMPADQTRDAVRDLVDDGISYLREVARIVAVLYGTPDLGNKPDPVDELVYIILSRKTREEAYQQAFTALKTRFATWDALLDADPVQVEAVLVPSGLGKKKTTSLFGALGSLRRRFGTCTLEPAKHWTDTELEAFLCSLPELHRKSAYCIMMYAFGRKVFPVDTHVGRVLARLGPYRELGVDLVGKDHKQLQSELADLVPPNLRYSLHVNLVVHGREVCRAVKPLCSECSLRNFCKTYRSAEASRIESLEQPRVVDLFTGAGGLSEGFSRAGFEIALALDADPVALRTYWLNHPGVRDDRVLCRDIRSLETGELRRRVGPRAIDVLIGAPPCQGFSHVGQRSKSSRTGYKVVDDERNYLYSFMVGAALELKPRLFLMENVPGMKSARKDTTSFLDSAAADLRAAGYTTATWRLNSAAFGVPQDRVRYFLAAARGMALPPPPAEAYQDGMARTLDVDALPPITLDEAIFDLPARNADEGSVVDLVPARPGAPDPRHRRYLSKFNLSPRDRLLFNHTVRYHNERDLELYALLQPGEDSVHALERYGRSDLMRYRSDVFDDKYARLRGDRPCRTIVSHLAKDGNGFIHPTQVRSISLREAARVQSFADDYVFCGSSSDQWVHVGNAVPPIMAEAIARSYRSALGRRRVR
jgi:DNA (cytosine-5)-methyltransferase 1